MPFADWGGPHRDGVSTEQDLIDEWPAGGPPVLWLRELGQGYSSFTVVADRAYTLTQDLWGQYLVCLDVRTGHTLWSHRYAAPYEAAGIYPGPRSTPCVVNGRVFSVSPDAVVMCVDAVSGEPIWTFDAMQRYRGEGTEFGYSASPRFIDGKLVLPVGGRNAAVVALDANTGGVLWTAGDEPASYCPVQFVELGTTRCGLAYLQNGLLLLRLSDGAVLWRMELSSGYDEHSAIPLVHENQFVISGPFRSGASAYRWDWNDSDTPAVTSKMVWTSTRLSNDTASSVLVDGAIYGFDLRDAQSKAHRPSRGEFRCLDSHSGEVRWSDATVGHATVLAADGKLILFNDRGELILAEARADQYRELGRAAVFADEICWTAPALSEGRLFLRTQTRAACIDLRQRDRTADALRSPPVERRLEELPQRPGAWRWDRLLNGEREHPFMRPHIDELWWWYRWCVAFAVAPALVLGWIASRLRPHNCSAGVATSVVAMFVLGSIGSAVLNARDPSRFTFTWPAALFAGFAAILWLGHSLRGRRLTWRGHVAARLGLLAFGGLCLAYFLALRKLSLPHEWVFLIGFLPAWWPTSRWTASLVKRGLTVPAVIAGWLTFSCYFWCCGGWELLHSWHEGR